MKFLYELCLHAWKDGSQFYTAVYLLVTWCTSRMQNNAVVKKAMMQAMQRITAGVRE
jgi:hypothetical protein